MCAIVAVTSLLIFKAVVSQGIDKAGAFVAGIVYIVWLGFMQGEGGQAEFIYAPLVLGSAITILNSCKKREETNLGYFIVGGFLAMLLIGVAIQIKYTVVIEGTFLGIWLAVTALRRPESLIIRMACVICFAVAALLPTLLCAGYYLAIGHIQEFIFANFQSMFGRNAETAENQTDGIIETGLILSPLIVAAACTFGRRIPLRHFFWTAWLVAAVGSYLLLCLFVTPHYAIPVLLPLTIIAAPTLGKRAVVVIFALAAIVSQFVLASNIARKGTAQTLISLASVAADRGDSCIYVYDGYSALYEATASCLPSRWTFPTHLAFQIENTSAGLGVDPSKEIRRILASEPAVIYDRDPADAGANIETRKILDEALAAHYRLATTEKLPSGIKLRAFTRYK